MSYQKTSLAIVSTPSLLSVWVEPSLRLAFWKKFLGKAIFALTATKVYPEEEIQEKLDKWFPTLQNALSDPLQNLIEK